MSDKMFFGHFRWLTATLTALLVAACAGPGAPKPESVAPEVTAKVPYLQVGYACCNLHYDGDLITDSNFGQLPFVPAGSLIKVRKIDGYEVHADIDNRPMRLVLEHRGSETTETWLGRIIVADDPRPRVAAFPPNIRNAIAAGKLLKGMTRQQAIIAVGYPQTSDKLRLDGSSWRHWWSGFVPYYVYWSGNKLSRIDGQGEVVTAVTYKGR